MGAVVVQNQMHVELGRNVGLNGTQKRQELFAAMAPMQLADDPTGRQIQGRKQARRAVTLVVMGASLRDSRRQRQQRLGPIQGLNLALLVHAQHHRFGGRIQVQPNDVAHLVA